MKATFVKCEKCGKTLIERLENGMWHFLFGKIPQTGKPVVDMKIYGSVQMQCIRKSCGHINTLNFFPEPIVARVRTKSTSNGVEKSPESIVV